MLLVDEAAIEAAILQLLEIEKTVAEGAGAAGLAAVTSYPERFRGRRVGLDPVRRQHRQPPAVAPSSCAGWSARGASSGSASACPDSPGSLASIAATIAEAGGNVVDVVHQRAFSKLSVKLDRRRLHDRGPGAAHADAITGALAGAGFAVQALGTDDGSGP